MSRKCNREHTKSQYIAEGLRNLEASHLSAVTQRSDCGVWMSFFFLFYSKYFLGWVSSLGHKPYTYT